jgi:hypothetical protein
VLLVSFLIGVALVQQWNWETTLALICAFCGFQAEHPLVLQIKQRKSWQPRYWFWGVVYGGIAGAITLYLAFTASGVLFPLFTIYGCAGLALMVDAISVFCRGQKSILNELVTFAAVCLVVTFTYLVTTHSFTPTAIRLWGLYRLYFSGTIFTVKLRKIRKQDSLDAALKRLGIYHAIAPLLILNTLLHRLFPPYSCPRLHCPFVKSSFHHCTFTVVSHRSHRSNCSFRNNLIPSFRNDYNRLFTPCETLKTGKNYIASQV